jgi:hypothetical protein
MSENLQLLQSLADKPAASQWFRDVLSYIRLEVTDTGETFTVICRGERVEVKPGFQPPARRKVLLGLFDPGDWYAKQFILPLKSENIRNFAAFFVDDIVDDQELYRVMAFIQPVLLKAALGMPVMRNTFLLNLFRLDTFWHQCLLDPKGNETQQCTVKFEHGQWSITPGYHGAPQRKKVLTASKLLQFQRRVHQAEVANTLAGWLGLAPWYHNWLASITVKA